MILVGVVFESGEWISVLVGVVVDVDVEDGV